MMPVQTGNVEAQQEDGTEEVSEVEMGTVIQIRNREELEEVPQTFV